jgi:hypothetical protein
MAPADLISLTAVLAACAYYYFAWTIGRQREDKPSIAPQYEPPSGLSPAMVRYIWKGCFDDRTFWASVLSLVARGLATIETHEDMAVLRATSAARHPVTLPPEERLLLKRVLAGSKRNGMPISMLDEGTALVASEMADELRQASVGELLLDNRNYLIAGVLFSMIALCLVARPSGKDDLIALVFGLAVMAPGAFYLLFLTLRIRDIIVVIRERLDAAVVRRAAVLVGLLVPCVAAIVLGSIVLTTIFGWQCIAAVVLLAGLTIWFSQRARPMTVAGAVALNRILGFRMFLQSVERLPLDREDAPADHAGVYEKYLPYAVALGVDQTWSDKLVALESSLHRCEALTAAHSFYLGMWNGKPVEMVFAPQRPRYR